MKAVILSFFPLVMFLMFFTDCNSSSSDNENKDSVVTNEYDGYASREKWGEHLVIISGCIDCHTPKKMTAQGPAPDDTRFLAGSPSPALLPAVMPGQVEKGMAATIDETAWIGPWGKSYSANLTSDSTGIGNWTEDQFITCIRKGITKGLPNSRPLMPPMPWQGIAQMKDDELKAVFAYLKSTKPVHNVVPAYEAPVVMK